MAPTAEGAPALGDRGRSRSLQGPADYQCRRRRLTSPRALDVAGDLVQHAGDVVSSQGQRANSDDRDQRDNQRVLDERLAFLGPHLRQLDPRREKLNHLALLSPLEVTCLSLRSCLRGLSRYRTPAKGWCCPALRPESPGSQTL